MEGVTALIKMPEMIAFGLLVAILLFYFSIKSLRTFRAMQFARWIVDNQGEPASNVLIEKWIMSAELNNDKETFMRHLIKLRAAIGHSNIKIGHLAYIDHLINKGREIDLDNLPKFKKDGI